MRHYAKWSNNTGKGKIRRFNTIRSKEEFRKKILRETEQLE